MSRGQIYRCLKSEVTDIDDLRDELISQNPMLERAIEKAFQYYGK